MKKNWLSDFYGIYFIGICGVSMSALAQYALMLKKRVGGSDPERGERYLMLKNLGAHIDDEGDDIRRYDCVVYSDAVHQNNEKLRLARSLGKKVMPRGKFLREMCNDFGRVIAVAGCHGKTTCTAMITSIFAVADKKFAAHIGGNAAMFGNFYMCGNDYFVTEACEYKKNFLLLRPAVAVVLSTEPDHLECYSGADDIIACYKKFSSSANMAVCRAGEVCADGAVTFGAVGADFCAHKVKCINGAYTFNAVAYGKTLGNIKLSVVGRYNIDNALAAIAVTVREGVSFEDIKRGLEGFGGVQRRMETLGSRGGVRWIADYAHHPSEIKCALKTAQKMTNGELYVIFQPHTYSRTINLFSDFISVLSGIRKLMIYCTFAAREYYDDAGSALTLSQSIKKCRYGETPSDISAFVDRAGEGDMVLFLGAGDIYDIAKQLLSE